MTTFAPTVSSHHVVTRSKGEVDMCEHGKPINITHGINKHAHTNIL